MTPNQENQTGQLKRPPIVPIEYAGKWIAWDREHTRIIASGRTLAEAVEAAKAAGEPEPLLAKVPKGAIPFIGSQL